MPRINNLSKLTTPPLLPFENPLFVEKQDKQPTRFECIAAFNKIPKSTPSFRGEKGAKVPFAVWAGLSLGTVLMPSIGSDGLNPAPVILLMLFALEKAISSTHIDTFKKAKIKDYVNALEVFMSNCQVHISHEDREKIRAQIGSLKKATNASHAAYLKQSKSKAPAVLPSMKRPVVSRPEIEWPNLNDANLNYASDAIGKVGQGLAAFGIGMLSVGAAFLQSH
jgi:hypothetical protein